MSFTLAFFLIWVTGLLSWLIAYGRGRRRGQHEAGRQVERELAPLLLEELLKQSAESSRISAEQTDALERYRKAGLN